MFIVSLGKKANHAPNKPEEEEDPISYDRIKGVIESEVTFDNQLTALLNTIQLTEFELITRYDVICTHLNEIFRPIFPECRTYKFGSTVAGLSFKESDLDIYMYVGEIGKKYYFTIVYISQYRHTCLNNISILFKVYHRFVINRIFHHIC